jgi:hypothetical protein
MGTAGCCVIAFVITEMDSDTLRAIKDESIKCIFMQKIYFNIARIFKESTFLSAIQFYFCFERLMTACCSGVLFVAVEIVPVG